MHRKCCIPGCNSTSKQKDVIMHRMPAAKEKVLLWRTTISAVPFSIFEGLTPVEISKLHVCHKHFEAKYVSPKMRLMPGARPTLFTLKEIASGTPMKTYPEIGPMQYGSKANCDHTYFRNCQYNNDHTYAMCITAANIDISDDAAAVEAFKSAEASASAVAAQPTSRTAEESEDTRADGLPLEYGLPSPDPDDGESAENTYLTEKPIFSWQKGELIEADDPDDPTPAPVPNIPEEVTTLSLFCEQDEDEVTQTEPAQVVPKGDEYQCKDCTQVIDGLSWWCVQCYGARCSACAALSPHRDHYVLRAPRGSRRSQTEAVLAYIRLQLQNENLPLFDVDDDGVKVEVKSEPEEPAHLAPDLPPAPPDPLADEPLRHLVLLPPGPQANVDSSNTAEQLDDHHLFKRPRLMNYRPIAPKASVTSNLVTPKLSEAKTNELTLLGILQNKNGSQPHVRPQQSILNTHSASNQSDSRGVQLRVKQGSRGPQLLSKGARHIKLVNGSPQLVVVQQFSEGSQLRKITDNHTLGSQILRKVQNLPKGQPLLKDLDLQSPRAHTSKELIHAAVKVTSEAQEPETVIIDLENVDDDVEFLDEEILDSEAENRDRNRIDEEQGEEDRDSEEGDTIDDRADQESRVESEMEDLESEVGDRIEDMLDQEGNEGMEGEMESEVGDDRTDRTDQESYMESEMDDDDDLDKDYRVEDDSVDETDVEDALERSVLTRTAAKVPIRGPQEEMVRKLPAEAMVQLRPLTSLDISQWTTGSG